MAICPFAQWDPVSGDLGNYITGPFKVVHHTTEGSTYAAAKAAYQAPSSDPHFTVDGSKIYQHIDTDKVARALKHAPSGVETNRASAVQIELVGFAGQPKDPAGLSAVAKLCRWIEAQHGIPQSWPNGHPTATPRFRTILTGIQRIPPPKSQSPHLTGERNDC